MRLFYAIKFPREVREALSGLEDNLRAQGVRGNFTDTGNLHLTLAFLGEVRDAAVAQRVLRALSVVPCELRLSGCGAFRDLWWVGLEKCEPLEKMVKNLRCLLRENGVWFDPKPFRPHITLIRNAHGPSDVFWDVPKLGFRAERVCLMESVRVDGKLVYREVDSKGTEG